MKWVEDYGTLFEKRIEIVLKQYPYAKGLLFYNKVNGILQNGPTCGFVAMSLAARSLSLDSHEVQHLIEYGKEKEYTNNGEMFSSEWVVKICRNFWGTAEVDVIPFPDHNQLVKEMFTGNVAFLMPHDSDKNFEPTKLNGHSAHWAVVIGFMLVVDIEVQENDETRPENEVEWCKSLPIENDSSKLYVIVFHGKSRTVIMRVDNHVHVRHIMLYHFEKGWKATESARDINELFGEGTIGERMVQKWLSVSRMVIHHLKMKKEEDAAQISMTKPSWTPWKKMKASQPEFLLKCLMSTNPLLLGVSRSSARCGNWLGGCPTSSQKTTRL